MSVAEIQNDWKWVGLLAGLVAIGWTNPGFAAQAAHSPARSEAVQHRVETTVTAQNTQVEFNFRDRRRQELRPVAQAFVCRG